MFICVLYHIVIRVSSHLKINFHRFKQMNQVFVQFTQAVVIWFPSNRFTMGISG